MTLTPFFNSYLTLNLLIVLCYFIFRVLRVRPSFKLQLEYITLGLMVLMTFIQPLMPRPSFTNTTIKVWAAQDMSGLEMSSSLFPKAQAISLAGSDHSLLSTQILSTGTALIFVLVFILGIFLMVREVLTLRKIKRDSFILRRSGKVTLLMSDSIQSPFSFWQPGHYYSIFPTSFLQHPEDFKVACYHELQHHRQGDTKWVYPLLALKTLCFLNPFAHLLKRDLEEVQEMSCDQLILENKNISTSQYMGCLIRVAQTTASKGFEPVCAAGFCFNQSRHFLKRRFQMMTVQHRPIGRLTSCALAVLMMSLMSFATYASKNMIQDRRITLEEAQVMAEKASEGSDFPIVMNSQVLEQLNRYLGTSEGRTFFKSSLKRKKEFNAVLEDITESLHTPEELNAIPIAESGFKNLPGRGKTKPAGLWMFIPATARRYGMKVQDQVDERLNVAKETDAAHRYLLSNKLIFNDWLLAIFAYNVGESAVARGIAKFKTRDPWELSKYIRGDKDYMSKVMASIIIFKNPEQLK